MTERKLIYLLSFIAVVAITTACKRNEVLSREKMVEVLCDIQLAEAAVQSRSGDFMLKEQKEALTRGVLKKHNITQARLDSSLVWYSDHVEIYNRVNDSVAAFLRREHDRLSKEMPRSARPRKVVNFNILPSFLYLTHANPISTFKIDSSGIKKYPDLKFDFKTKWISDADIDVSVVFEYHDTIVTKSLKPDRDSLYTIVKPDIADSLKAVSGYIYLHSDKIHPRNVLFYDITVTDSIKTNLPDADTKTSEEVTSKKEVAHADTLR